MPVHQISGVSVRGIACAVPKHSEGLTQLESRFGSDQAARLFRGTGISERRIAQGIQTSELCESAASVLFDSLGWDPRTISHLIFVSQTPDFVLPATSCVIQERLGLSKEVSALDINQGCAGYPYALWIASKILAPGERALLLVGDTISKFLSPDDKSTVPIFGDAGSATLVEAEENSTGWTFVSGTDGEGFTEIMVTSQQGKAEKSLPPPGRLIMNGASVFAFALKHVPELVASCLKYSGWSSESCDDFVFHQASGFLLNSLRDKLDIPQNRFPINISKFGNTSSASIPLALVTERRSVLEEKSKRYLLAGFGVGWSWAGAAISLGPISVPELIEI